MAGEAAPLNGGPGGPPTRSGGLSPAFLNAAINESRLPPLEPDGREKDRSARQGEPRRHADAPQAQARAVRAEDSLGEGAPGAGGVSDGRPLRLRRAPESRDEVPDQPDRAGRLVFDDSRGVAVPAHGRAAERKVL